MTQPTGPDYEPMTPIDSERLLRQLGQGVRDAPAQIRAAQDKLTEARKMLTSAKAALKIGKARATLSPDCPRVGVIEDDGRRITVADRNSWVDIQTQALSDAVDTAAAVVDAARAVVDAAHENRRSLREQVMAASSLNASVREAYRGIGGVR